MENREFCKRVIALIGQPYSETDCIGVIRKAANIRCQGTNWLWRSYNNAAKYRYLTQRMDRAPTMSELSNGLLVFRIQWDSIPDGYSDRPNCHHVGVIVDGDVIQSSESKGVYRKPYNDMDWDGCGWLKQIDFPKRPSTFEEYELSTNPDIYTEPPVLYEPSDHDMILALYNKFIVD